MTLSSLLKKIQENNKTNNIISKVFNFFVLKKKIKGDNNRLLYKAAYLYKVKINISGDNNQVVIGSDCKFKNCTIIISGSDHKLYIGNSCFIENTKFHFTQNDGRITIGNHTTVNGGQIYSGESKSIEIGEDCMLSSNIDIRTTDSHSIVDKISGRRLNEALNIKIGNHVWLGNSSKIWKGANIGENTIIGASSVVTKTIKANSTAVGAPAKEISENVTWDRRIL